MLCVSLVCQCLALWKSVSVSIILHPKRRVRLVWIASIPFANQHTQSCDFHEEVLAQLWLWASRLKFGASRCMSEGHPRDIAQYGKEVNKEERWEDCAATWKIRVSIVKELKWHPGSATALLLQLFKTCLVSVPCLHMHWCHRILNMLQNLLHPYAPRTTGISNLHEPTSAKVSGQATWKAAVLFRVILQLVTTLTPRACKMPWIPTDNNSCRKMWGAVQLHSFSPLSPLTS